MTEPGWVEVSYEREMVVAQESARAALALRGVSVDDLGPDVLRIDVGLDENRATFYRVCIHESVFGLG